MPSIPPPPSIFDTALDRTLLGYGKLGYLARRSGWDEELPRLDGQVAIVTGAKTGLGRATAKGLAELGATVRLAVRGREDGERVKGELEAEVPGARLAVDELDVSSLAAVRAYAAAFEGPLHVLVHNAGVMPAEREETEEGHERMLATHVLGPHLLTKLLRPHMPADVLSSHDLCLAPDRSRVAVAGMAVARQRPATANGVVFMLLEDEFGQVNLIVPPQIYERHRAIVRGEPLILARGVFERVERNQNVLVHELETLAPLARKLSGAPDLVSALPDAHHFGHR